MELLTEFALRATSVAINMELLTEFALRAIPVATNVELLTEFLGAQLRNFQTPATN